MPEPAAATELDSWSRRIQDLAALHRDLELRALGLPVFSLAPSVIYLWNAVKLTLFMELDLFLLVPVLIPMYLVVFIRNRLPGKKWRYRSFSRKYFAYVIRWVWSGESPSPAGVVVRRLVILALHLHFRTRLHLLRNRLALEEHLTSQDRNQLLSTLDNVLDGLGGRGIPGWYAYVLPLASFFLGLFNAFHTGPSSVSAEVLGFTLVGASFSFIISTLIVKRGLLLGGIGRSCYFPGAIVDRGAYAAEKRIFEPIGVAVQEVPLDILAVVLTFSFQTLIPKTFFDISQRLNTALGFPAQSQTEYLKILWLFLAVQVCICGLVYYRRIKLNRL